MSVDEKATPVTTGMRAFDAAGSAYRAVFARSPLAGLLSHANPRRREGYRIPVRVHAIRDEADGVRSFALRSRDGAPLSSWNPGAHVDVFLPGGRQRTYSLCGAPEDRSTYRIAVRRLDDGDGGSVAMHQLSEGDELEIQGPRNAFPFHTAPSYHFIAGGIGITALLPMIRRAEETGARWSLVYLGRSRAALPFLAELEDLDAGRGRVDVLVDDVHGRPDIVPLVARAEPGASVYMCGPPPIMTTARGVIRSVNPAASLHTERFSPPGVSGGQPFTVSVVGLSEPIEVAADQTMLEAVREVVPEVQFSCRQGVCGSCRTRVVSGEIDHRDHRLSPYERDENMLICVSRAAGSAITVDLTDALERRM